jgi:hypothetical protein
MYGSRTDSKGQAIQGDSSFVSAVAGERVPGNTLVSIGLSEDKDGNVVETRATIEFQQSNGAKVRMTIFEPNDDDQQRFEQQQVSVERNIKHLATKLMTEDEYYSGMEAGGLPKTFPAFIAKVSALLMPKAAGKVFTMKFVYSNGWVTVPKFPNWIALPGNEDTLSTNAKYDKYTPETPSAAPSVVANGDVF